MFEDCFRKKDSIPYKYRGNEFISIKIDINTDNESQYILGTIYKYTKITSDKWFDIERGEPLETDEEKPNIDTEKLFPNLMISFFCFIPNGHRLFLLTKYQKSNISPAFFARALGQPLNMPDLVDKYGKTELSVETDSKSIDTILNMDILSQLRIRFNIPNADDISEYKQKIIDKLRNQNGRTLEQKITAEKEKTIKPDRETKALMQLALSNGFIFASGEENGAKVTKMSSEMPIQEVLNYDDSEDIKKVLYTYSKSRLPFFISRQKNDDDFH